LAVSSSIERAVWLVRCEGKVPVGSVGAPLANSALHPTSPRQNVVSVGSRDYGRVLAGEFSRVSARVVGRHPLSLDHRRFYIYRIVATNGTNLHYNNRSDGIFIESSLHNSS
jgi:hypothetical protein